MKKLNKKTLIKNPTVNSVQRDYMAGEVSKDLTRRILLPEDIVKAHDEGLIHFHMLIISLNICITVI